MTVAPFDLNEIRVLIQDNLSNGVIEKTLETLSETDLEKAIVEFGGLTDPIGQLESWLSQQLQSFGNWLVQSFESVISPIANAVNSLASQVYSGLSSLSNTISSAFSTLGNQLLSLFSNLENALSSIASGLSSLGNALQSALSSIITNIQYGFDSIANVLRNITLPNIQNFVNQVLNAIGGIAKQVEDYFSDIVNGVISLGNKIRDALSGLWNEIGSIFSKAKQDILGFFSELGRQFNAFIKAVGDFGSFLQSSLAGLIKPILDFFANLGKGLYDLLEKMKKGFEELLSAIGNIPQFFSKLGSALDDFINNIKRGFEGFIDFIKNIPSIIGEIPQKVFEAVKEAFLKFLESTGLGNVISAIVPAFTNILNFLNNLINSKAIGNFLKYLELVMTDMESGFRLFMGFAQAIFNDVVGFVRGLAQGMINIGNDLVNAFKGFASQVPNSLKEILTTTIQDSFVPAMITVMPMLGAYELVRLKPVIIFKSGIDPQKVIGPSVGEMFLGVGLASAVTFGSIYGLGSIVKHIAKAVGDLAINLRPLGLGITYRVKLSELIEPIGDVIEKMGEELGRGLALSGTLAFLEPLKYVWQYVWWLFFYSLGMGDIPFELPSYHELIHVARRFGITDNVNNIANTMIYRGFPYWFISRTIAIPNTLTSIDVATKALEEFEEEIRNNYVSIVDKFGNTRYIPVSPVFELPTIHDLVHFMLRDLFLPARAPPEVQPVLAYKSFIKAMWIHGVPPDVAYMYYLISYELPSTSDVWEFTMRAIAGFAWYVPPPEVQAFANAEAEIINAFKPEVPAKLNFKYDLLLSALAEYQKWHGRAHFAWLADARTGQSYTSDAWLIIDQSAHLMDRTDMEHLLRHGIWDYFQRKYSITNETTMYDVLTKIVEPKPSSPIQIYTDYITNAFMARGFHPYIIPLIIARDVLDVTTPAKTLLRTGLIEMVRSNIETIQTALGLMNYFFDVSVHVAYFDMNTRRWVTGWINVPVRYLEPEAKLLMIRSLMDKVNRAVRSMYNAVLRGVRDNLINVKESVGIMESYVMGVLDRYFAQLYREITGREMHLEWDEMFNEAIINYFSIEQTIATYRRIRNYARYALFRILQLISGGAIPKDKIESYVNGLTELMRETQQAKSVFMYIAELEYSRSLLRNYETLARVWLTRHALTPDQVEQIMISQGMDPTYVKTLVSAYAVPYYPTIAQLAFLSEYNPAFLDKIGQVTQLMRIPNDWADLWKAYVHIRAYFRWIIRALNAFIPVVSTIPLSVNVQMPQTRGTSTTSLSDVAKSVFERLEKFGFDDTKLGLVKEIIDYRRLLNEYRHSIPTTWQSINFSIYVPDPDQFIDSLSPYWVVNQLGLNLIKTLARFRRYNRWLHQTVYWAVRAYAKGYMSGQALLQFLQSLQQYGLSKYDIEMIRNLAFAMSCYYGGCQYPW